MSAGSTAGGALPGLRRQIAAMTGGVAYPFGSRLVPYVAGIRPSQSNAAMDSLLTAQYDAWKAARVVSVPWIAAGGYAVQFSNTSYLTVSEGMGYGMLLAVLFAGHDPQARTLFDGLLAVARARPAWAVSQYDPNGKYLMEWQLWSNGSSAGSGWNAMDGDLDMAMALLMADKQWGSSGSWNYLQEGKNTIAALKSFNMASNGATKGLAAATNNRTSDYMVGHFRAFKAATGDTLWDAAVDRAYSATNYLQNTYSPGVGLMPDFAMGTNTSTPWPSTGYIGDGNANEGYYWWNACRNPWRFSSDYVLTGDSRFAQVTGRMIDFFQRSSGGDPMQIGMGYALDGTKLTWGNSPAYHGPICAGACVDPRFQGFLDTMWNWNAGHLITGYYDSELQLLSMVVASGNWWSPATAVPTSGGTTTQQAPAQPATQPATTTAAAAAGNVLANGDFSNGMANWSNWGNAQVIAGALQVGAAAGGAGQDIAGKLTAGTKYQLTGTANITSPGQGVYVGVKLMDAWGGILVDQAQLVTSQTPASGSVTFTVPQGVASGYVYVWKNGDSATAIVDSLVLAPAGSGGTQPQRAPAASGGANVLANGNFASGLASWNNWGNSQAVSGAVQVGTGAGGVAQDIGGKVNAGTKYQLTGLANVTAWSEGVFVGVKLMDAWGNVLVDQAQNVTATSPTGVSVAFTAPAGATTGYVYVWKNANNALALVSQLSLSAV